MKNGDLLKSSSLSPVGLKVWINGARYKNIRVSADGKFLNLIPLSRLGEGIKHLKIKYGTYKRGSWLTNRLKQYFTKKQKRTM